MSTGQTSSISPARALHPLRQPPSGHCFVSVVDSKPRLNKKKKLFFSSAASKILRNHHCRPPLCRVVRRWWKFAKHFVSTFIWVFVIPTASETSNDSHVRAPAQVHPPPTFKTVRPPLRPSICHGLAMVFILIILLFVFSHALIFLSSFFKTTTRNIRINMVTILAKFNDIWLKTISWVRNISVFNNLIFYKLINW